MRYIGLVDYLGFMETSQPLAEFEACHVVFRIN